MLKAVIAEDDSILRKNIIKKLSMHPEIEITYSTNNGSDLLKAITKIKPELIITDIAMPEMSGIEVIKNIRDKLPDTEIIFITSHGEFIKEAVNLYAYDYLEKPIDYQRLAATITRITQKISSSSNLIQFTTEEGNEIVKEQDIYIIEAAQKETIVYTKVKTFTSTDSLKEAETLLNKETFFKTSRSFIVNILKIRSIKKAGRTSFKVYFVDKDYEAYLSKTRYEEFRRAIKSIRRNSYD
ncbi:MAG: LytR/AlgR family response regulator transcription factor [Bacillota bacterium]